MPVPEDGRRYEIYDGEVFVVPSPLPLHQIVALNVYDWLRHHPRTRAGLVAPAPLDIVFSEHNVVQPDVLYFEPGTAARLSRRTVIRTPAGSRGGSPFPGYCRDRLREEDAVARPIRREGVLDRETR